MSRISATAESRDIQLVLDVNTEIYPLKQNQKLSLSLSNTLSLDGLVEEKEAWRENLNKKTMADDYEYVMSGKVYKFDDNGSSKWYLIRAIEFV